MSMAQKSDLIATVLIKVKLQGKESDIEEFKNRLKPHLSAMDCSVLEESDYYRNRTSEIFRTYVTYVMVGLNKRR